MKNLAHEPEQAEQTEFGAEPTSASAAIVELSKLDPKEAPDELLVAVLLAGSTGRQDPKDVARDILIASRGNLEAVVSSPALTEEIKGLGPSGRARLVAASELYRRAAYRASALAEAQVLSPREAVDVFRTIATGPDERFVALYLDSRRRPIHSRTLSVGSPQFTIVDPRVVYRTAIGVNASAVIVAHHHPSGDPTPSQQDKDVTTKIAAAGRVVGIPLLDHIVIGAGGMFTSLAEIGVMPSTWDTEKIPITGGP